MPISNSKIPLIYSVKDLQLRICLLSVNFLPNIGGVAAHIYELSKTLVENGNEVYVFTFKEKLKDVGYEEIDGIQVYRTFIPRIRFLWVPIYTIQVWVKIIFLHYRNKIDVIHYHNVFPDALIAMFVCGIPKIQTEHSLTLIRGKKSGRNSKLIGVLLKLGMNRLFFKNAKQIIAITQELVDEFTRLGVDQKKITYIPNGVDTVKFNPALSGNEIKEKYGIVKRDKIILCPRRLVPEHGILYLIQAIPDIVKVHNKAQFIIMGDGPDEEDLKREVEELLITQHVIFTGSVPNTEMSKYYAVSDVVVLPSLTEGMSISGLEAMAAGKPLVGTRVGGTPQIIDDNETGILVSPQNSKELAKAIIFLLDNDEKRNAMGLKARKRTEEEFSWGIVAGKTQTLYKQFAKNGANN